MNNKKRFTLYPVTKQGEVNGFMSILHDQIDYGDDPILLWAEHGDLDDAAMATMLDCPLATYRLHKQLEGVSPASPLSVQHVLNFCEKSGIHPADLSSTAEHPENSCRPYIYAAILHVQKHGKYKADQKRAEGALNSERSRYEYFIELYPQAAEFISDIQSHRVTQGINTNEVVMKTDELKSCFKDKAIDLDLPQYHTENYHLHLLPGMKEKLIEINDLKKDERFRRVDLTRFSNFLFGRHKSHEVAKAVEDLAQLLDNETRYKMPRRIKMLTERLLARFPVSQRKIEMLGEYEKYIGSVSAAGCVEQFSKAALSLRAFQKGEYTEQLALLEQSVERDRDFEEWIRLSDDPKFFYMQYIYQNNVMDVDRPPTIASVVVDNASRYDHS